MVVQLIPHYSSLLPLAPTAHHWGLCYATELGIDDCIKHAISLVQVVSGPLFTKLDFKKLGEYSRALSVSKEYGTRLLQHLDNWNPEQTREVIQKLVYGYPSHGYVIDYYELKALGFNVKLFSEEEKVAVEALFKDCLTKNLEISSQTTIKLVELSDTSNVQPTSRDELSAHSAILLTPTVPNDNSQQVPLHNEV